MIHLRIGIVSWNTAHLLDACLSTLSAATADVDAEVVVVDNASSDDSPKVVESHRVCLIQNSENFGYAKAMNQALTARVSEREPDVLVALNPDTLLPENGLSLLAERLLSDPGVGLVAPQLVYPDGSHQHSVYRFPSPAVSLAAGLVPPRLQTVALRRGSIADRFWLETGARHDRPADVDWVIGAVHVMRPEAVGRAGPYDERWFMYVEDLDLCWRLAKRGWRRRLEPEVKVVHVGNAAGAQAWGDERLARWLEATYDWYRLRLGSAAARVWAAANLAGVMAHLPSAALRQALDRGLEPWQKDLRRSLRIHARNLLMRSRSSSDGVAPTL
jgi:GT2 family glycosyltransferase